MATQKGAAPEPVVEDVGPKFSQEIFDAIIVKVTDVKDDSLLDFAKIELSKAIEAHITSSLLENNKVYHQMAKSIKIAFDDKHTKSWHCVVGRNFGTQVIHKLETMMFLSYETTACLIWKCGNNSA
jgi:dynein light chain LC8-type